MNLDNFKAPLGEKWNEWRIMDDAPLEVDMICSLGGDCIAASQQKFRGLRRYSLPFDWCWNMGESAFYAFSRMIEDNFSKFAMKENMIPLPGTHFGYKDYISGYCFIHHFKEDIGAVGEYERFSSIIKRRFSRFFDELNRSSSILFLASYSSPLSNAPFYAIERVCKLRWPDKQFHFIVVTYNSFVNEVSRENNIIHISYARDRTIYDTRHCTFEWSFLDNVHYSLKTLMYFDLVGYGKLGVYDPVLTIKKLICTWRIDCRVLNDDGLSVLAAGDGVSVIYPHWISKGAGKGFVVSGFVGRRRLKVQCKGAGILEFALKGADRRSESKRIPIYVNYRSFKVNGREYVTEPMVVWHDAPKCIQFPVHESEDLTVEIFSDCPHFEKQELLARLRSLVPVSAMGDESIDEALDVIAKEALS